jgi:DNA-binding beta-propeller fold protein YncE
VKRIRAALIGGLALLVAGGALAEPSAPSASTLLIPRTAEGTLDFVDPGSGLRLASIALDTGPRQVSVSPDGKRAAVLGCGPSSMPDASSVRLSIVDLEQPRELHRIELGTSPCPQTLTWFGADRVAVEAAEPAPGFVIEAGTGRIVGTPTAEDRAAIEHASSAMPAPDPTTVAVQQFLSSGGRLSDLALTPILPRAVCHACTPESSAVK